MPRVPEHLVVRRTSKNNLTLTRAKPRTLDDSAILIRMLSAGVCGTDLAMLSGNRAVRAEVLGHEGVGHVLHAPQGCGVAEGARIVVNPVHRQHPDIVIGHSCDGVFRDLFWLDGSEALAGGLAVSCPAQCALDNPTLALTEPLASALYSVELLRERCGDSALLIRGSGTVGILIAKLWSRRAGSTAILVSSAESHASWLREVTNWRPNVRICSSSEAARVVRECGGAAVAVLCCSRKGTPEGLRSLLALVEHGAAIDLMAGFPTDYRESRLDGVQLDSIRWNNICGVSSSPPTAVVDRSSGKTIYLTGHRGTAERHILGAIELLSEGTISLADIPHCVLALEQLPEAVTQMLSTHARHTTKWVKAIVDFSREGYDQPTN